MRLPIGYEWEHWTPPSYRPVARCHTSQCLTSILPKSVRSKVKTSFLPLVLFLVLLLSMQKPSSYENKIAASMIISSAHLLSCLLRFLSGMLLLIYNNHLFLSASAEAGVPGETRMHRKNVQSPHRKGVGGNRTHNLLAVKVAVLATASQCRHHF